MTSRQETGVLPTTLLQCLADGTCRTIDELDVDLPLTRRQISDGAVKLILRGYAERIEVGCYRLTHDGLSAAARGEVIKSGPWRPDTGRARKPVANTFRQRVWTVMRMSGSFTLGDLVMAAAGADDRDAGSNASFYIRRLIGAGYVFELPVRQRDTKVTSNGIKRFRLLKDTGPKAPVYRSRTRSIYDYNTAEDVPCGK